MKFTPFKLGLLLSPILLILYIGFNGISKAQTKKDSFINRPSLLEIGFIPNTLMTPLPTYSFMDMSSQKTKTLNDLQGKPVILHFWATWCGHCVKELPFLDKFAKDYQDKFHIIALTTETDQKMGESIRKFYEEKGIKHLTICLDPKGYLSQTFKVKNMPTTIFISSKGQEMGRITGAIEWKAVAGEVLADHLLKS
ncbi:MAG: TlpA family protein disulfide reductase [Proteobacteria bacterium]|nr:TlpA family protein disulfide reductase [Pseudomonadota bacterium]